ncbi:hypothetical protein EON77_05115 [bacterium]|nr:MAG: hypothetical protein EON77_05115 [bacterium]
MAPTLVLAFAVSALSVAWIVGVARMVFGGDEGARARARRVDEFSSELPLEMPEHVSFGRISRL